VYNYIGDIMLKISGKESEIGNILNEKRIKAYLDIYKETEFSGVGILIDENLNVYKYIWGIGFDSETHNFSNNSYLYKSDVKINYEELENFLIKDMNIVEIKYLDNTNKEEQYSEIIKLKTYVNEFSNKILYDKIKEKVSIMIKEDL